MLGEGDHHVRYVQPACRARRRENLPLMKLFIKGCIGSMTETVTVERTKADTDHPGR